MIILTVVLILVVLALIIIARDLSKKLDRSEMRMDTMAYKFWGLADDVATLNRLRTRKLCKKCMRINRI